MRNYVITTPLILYVATSERLRLKHGSIALCP